MIDERPVVRATGFLSFINCISGFGSPHLSNRMNVHRQGMASEEEPPDLMGNFWYKSF